MVRYQSSDTDSSTEDSSSSTIFSEFSSSEDEEQNNGHLRYEDSSDGGRDHCECSYDYRGELDEIFCPRCRKEVREEYDDDEDEDWYIQPTQQRIQQPTRLTVQEPVSVKTQIVPRDSDESYDTWPSGDEEAIVNENGQMKCFRLSQVVKTDLDLLTGSGLVSQEEYDGDLDENEQIQKKRMKQFRKTMKSGRERL